MKLKDWIKRHEIGIIMISIATILWLSLIIIIIWPNPSQAPIFAGEPEVPGNGSAIVNATLNLYVLHNLWACF